MPTLRESLCSWRLLLNQWHMFSTDWTSTWQWWWPFRQEKKPSSSPLARLKTPAPSLTWITWRQQSPGACYSYFRGKFSTQRWPIVKMVLKLVNGSLCSKCDLTERYLVQWNGCDLWLMCPRLLGSAGRSWALIINKWQMIYFGLWRLVSVWLRERI